MPKTLFQLIGSKIRFRTCGGEYEGVINSISFYMKRVNIKHVHLLPAHKYLGELSFFINEILSYVMIQPKNELAESNTKTSSMLNCLSNRQENISISSHDYSKELKSADSASHENSLSKKIILNLPPNLQDLLPKNFVILEKFDLEFQHAIYFISQQRSIGLSFEGFKVSCHGKLSLICISTIICVFLFDFEKLGKNALDKGLRDIFLNEKIIKVIHNFRLFYTCLNENYSTTLRNVFDTHEADIVVEKQMCKDDFDCKPVRTLEDCIETYLAVPKEYLYVVRECHFNQTFYCKRPIGIERLNIFIKNVIYLLLLQEKLSKLLSNPLCAGLNVRCCSDQKTPISADKQEKEMHDKVCETFVDDAFVRRFNAAGLDDRSFFDEEIEKFSKPKQISALNNTDCLNNSAYINFPGNENHSKQVRKAFNSPSNTIKFSKNEFHAKFSKTLISDSNDTKSCTDVKENSLKNESNDSHHHGSSSTKKPAVQLKNKITFIPAGME